MKVVEIINNTHIRKYGKIIKENEQIYQVEFSDGEKQMFNKYSLKNIIYPDISIILQGS